MSSEDILMLLKDKKDFTSGAEIAERLKITRTAVWKRIKLLRKRGYKIEASPSKGYKLIRSPDFSIEGIKASLSNQSSIIGRKILFLDDIGSTNTYAMGLAEKGYPDGSVIISNCQTGGKGRLGRSWFSPPDKNLYMSIILKPSIPPMDAPIITLMSAVACISAIKNFLPSASIKWPNDLMISEKKFGGILTEIKADMDSIFYAVVGIGINVNIEAEEMPDEIREYATSIKIETGKKQARNKIAIDILKEMDKWYSIFSNNGKRLISEEWLRLSSTIGRAVKAVIGENIFQGTAQGIDENGMLILRLSDNSIKKISAGDVTHIRQAEQ